MEPLTSPGFVLGSPEPPTPQKERRSALKSAISYKSQSNKSQVQVHVQFAGVSIDYAARPLSPQSPNTECSAPRPEYRPALQRNISSGSIARSSLKSPLAYETEFPCEVTSDLTISVSSSASTQDDGYFSRASSGTSSQTDISFASTPQSPSFHGRLGERSSARVSAREIEDVKVLKNIMTTLRVNKIPGPQLFRSQTEFPTVLGFGGEGNVRAIDASVKNSIKSSKLSRPDKPKWKSFAIKRHGPQEGKPAFKLKNYLAAAEAEINALSNPLRGHPNIVQLTGWGLCLDTLESTQNISEPQTDLSMSNLHLPLLVLELANGDLAQFLKDIFDNDKPQDVTCKCSQESRAERGLSQPRYPATVWGPSRPEQVSLSGSTLQGDDDEPHKYTTIGAGAQEASSNSKDFWVVNGMNRHELLRRLCIDIGHGLQGLHDVNMTHGDLKPRNVLVFRNGPVWTAKLCDFGHSNSFDSSNDDAPYIGTPDWRPYWFGSVKVHRDIATLKSFDLAVYGALLWSAFCPSLRGKAPPISDYYDQSNPCKKFEKHIRDIGPSGCGPSILGSKAALIRRIDRLVHGTLCASYLRSQEIDDGVLESQLKHHLDERPWEHLYSKTVRSTRSLWSRIPVIKQGVKRKINCEQSATDITTETDSNSGIETQTQRRQKASATSHYLAVHTEEWRGRPCGGLHQTALLTTTNRVSLVENSIVAAHHEAMTLCRGMAGSLDGLQALHDNLQRLIHDLCTGVAKPELLHDLARLRATEVKSIVWNNITSRRNIVALALGSTSPVKITTMAWLCKGEVGAHEVRSLPAHYSAWKNILDAGVLNESERLERFLLLMRFGALIGEILEGHPNIEEPQPILNMYLHSCRLATRGVVANEICRHYEQTLATVELNRCQPDATRYYMTAARSCRPKGMSDHPVTIAKSTALGRIESDRRAHKAAYPSLKLNFEQLLDEQNDIYRARAKRPGDPPSETTPLLATNRRKLQRSPTLEMDTPNLSRDNPTGPEPEVEDRQATSPDGLPLPSIKPSLPGWSECGNAFINDLTRSVTFKRPTVKLTQLRHINIGHIGSESVLEIDMADFVLPGDPEEDQQALRQRIRKRFPLFDAVWYSSRESLNIFSDYGEGDVLADLKDDEKWEQEPTQALLSAFEIKPPDFSIEAFLSKNLSTLLFFIQNPTTTFGLLWELVIYVHDMAGAPIVVSYVALRNELRSLDTTRRPLFSLLRWVPMVFGRTLVLLLAGLVCLVGAALVVAIVLAFMLG
ncbi:hypothetical protein GGR55DRAFT_634900 [Xylaria sp. FL0064]|nr:hypothetical protein GGR55DRAFT_634900 [Xylaria sp. FL0064]